MAIVVLAWLGLAFGSFVNALVWRVHEQDKGQRTKGKKDLSILNGRSMCPHCHHMLAWYDLVPVLSWIMLKGRCRYCSKPISWQYPLVELAGAVIFVLSYLLWPGGVHAAGDWVLFVTWLATSVGLLALLVYDALWMILPNRIVYPTAAIAAAGRLIFLIGFEEHKGHGFLVWAGSVAVASGIFWLLFVLSSGRWIGFGDVRLGLITGTVLSSPSKSFLMILLGSILGTLFIIPGLLTGQKTVASKLPFGPFLIAGCAIALLLGGDILDWYQRALIP